ncbi:MAG: extracellular solute-binding protein [Candidatus Omnitrophica bacterium]|nr:extracellular solute-binding protein [Candidatus Omnitrophota bacterium]
MKKSFLAALSLIFLLAGCSQVGKQTNMITVWHWMTDRQDAFLKLAEQYKQQTGIEVNFELYAPSDIYSRKIIAAAQASVLPDIFGVLGEKEKFVSFIESGFVADLTEEFQANDGEWEKSLFAKALNVNRFEENNIYKIKPGIYGVPIDVTNIQMLYNQDLLTKAGIKKPPVTFDEFLSAIAALNRIGIPGFVSGWGETWMIDCFASNYAFNIMGEEKVMATYRGEVPYTDEDWIKVFNIFKIFRDKNALIEGVVTRANKYAEQDFALARAAFAFNGSWCVNIYDKMNPNLHYGVMLPPRINLDRPMQIWGGAGSSFVVNGMSKNKKQVIDFLKWLTAKDQQVFLSQETRNLPANRDALSEIPKVLSEFAGSMDSTTHPSIWKYNEAPLVIEAFDKGIQSIIIGEAQPEQIAAEVQKIKVREMERLQKQSRK